MLQQQQLTHVDWTMMLGLFFPNKAHFSNGLFFKFTRCSDLTLTHTCSLSLPSLPLSLSFSLSLTHTHTCLKSSCSPVTSAPSPPHPSPVFLSFKSVFRIYFLFVLSIYLFQLFTIQNIVSFCPFICLSSFNFSHFKLLILFRFFISLYYNIRFLCFLFLLLLTLILLLSVCLSSLFLPLLISVFLLSVFRCLSVISFSLPICSFSHVQPFNSHKLPTEKWGSTFKLIQLQTCNYYSQ